jgi:hypothetical protein
MPDNEEFSTVFGALRAILNAHKDRLSVTVRSGRNYVSFHFMPVYMDAELQKQIPPELRKRMRGKACFNFKTVDQELFRQLAELTSAGLDRFERGKFDWPGIEVAQAAKS